MRTDVARLPLASGFIVSIACDCSLVPPTTSSLRKRKHHYPANTGNRQPVLSQTLSRCLYQSWMKSRPRKERGKKKGPRSLITPCPPPPRSEHWPSNHVRLPLPLPLPVLFLGDSGPRHTSS